MTFADHSSLTKDGAPEVSQGYNEEPRYNKQQKKVRKPLAKVLISHDGSINVCENFCSQINVVSCPQDTVKKIHEKILMILNQHQKSQKLVLNTATDTG